MNEEENNFNSINNNNNMNNNNNNNDNININSEQKNKKLSKIFLMGKCGVGKTSMRSIIFANQAPKDTFVLGYTSEVAETRLKFMGNLIFNLLDCGGQEQFMKQYFETKRESIFSKVGVLIFVVEAVKTEKKLEKQDNIEDLTYFENCINALNEFSPDAKIFVLIHKMDLIKEQNKQKEIFEMKKKELESKSKNFEIKCFATSIWESSLYKAWTEIVASLTHNLSSIQESLKNYAIACNAEEVILFEKNTFLLTCSYSNKKIQDEQRFEKISHIIKKFKLSCMTMSSNFKSMIIQTRNFTTYLDKFTKSTYIMVIISDKSPNLELLKLNTKLCRKKFEEKLEYSLNN